MPEVRRGQDIKIENRKEMDVSGYAESSFNLCSFERANEFL